MSNNFSGFIISNTSQGTFKGITGGISGELLKAKSNNLLKKVYQIIMSKIQLTIRAGGSGIRLWPLSRQNFPKQSSKMIGANSLFQKTLLRFKSSKKF